MYLVSKVVELVFPFLHTSWSIHLGLKIRKRKKSGKFNVTRRWFLNVSDMLLPEGKHMIKGQLCSTSSGTFYLERSSFSYLLVLTVMTQCSASLPVLL